MPSAEVVARFFLHLAALDPEPSPITPMQLHKLLYYAQGWQLATRGQPLFPSRFQAWVHGPVEVNTYPIFADYQSGPISMREARDDPSLSTEHRDLIEYVWNGYGRYAAWQLRQMTHNEAPWRDARGDLPESARSEAPIADEALRAFFYPQHEKACRQFGLSPVELDRRVRDAKNGAGIPLEVVRAELLAEMSRRAG